MAELRIDALEKRFGDVVALQDIDLQIRSGEFVVFVGPSGCGKSTLLRCIAGLEPVSGGTVVLDGQNVTDRDPSKRGMAMVFQSYALYPHMSVFDNVAYALRIAGMPRPEIDARVLQAATTLQIDQYLDRRPRALSGGQRQRVAIARAMVREPAVFLFDEPLSNLDAALRMQTRNEIADLKQRLPGTTMIYVTHDQVEAMTLADRIVVLRAGRIEQVGTPRNLYDAPATRFVAGFIGQPPMNVLPAFGSHPERAREVGVRPEHLRIAASGELTGRVLRAEFHGAEALIFVRLDAGDTVMIRTGSGEIPQAQAEVALAIERRYFFDDMGTCIGSAGSPTLQGAGAFVG